MTSGSLAFFASIAQMVEHCTDNAGVNGSIPFARIVDFLKKFLYNIYTKLKIRKKSKGTYSYLTSG